MQLRSERQRVELGNLELGSLPQKMANNIDSSASLVSDGMQMSILSMGVEFTYCVPTFSVIRVPLREVTVQIEDSSGSVYLFDGFIRSEPSMRASTHVPTIITLREHCFIPVSTILMAQLSLQCIWKINILQKYV